MPPGATPPAADDPAEDLLPYDPEESARKPEGFDWLSLALILVILVNLALYFYGRSPGETKAPVQGAAQGAPPPPGRPPTRPATVPAAGKSGPVSQAPAPTPKGGGGPSQPATAPSHVDLDPFLNTEAGAEALIAMHRKGGKLALAAHQKTRIKAYLEDQRALASLGSQVASIESLLTPAQAALLEKDRETFAGGRQPQAQDPIAAAIKALETRARDAASPQGEAQVDVPDRGPSFDPNSLALGLLHLEQKGAPLRLDPAQAAVARQLLEEIQEVTKRHTRERLERILTAPQRTFLSEQVTRLGEEGPGPPASSSSQARVRLDEALSR